MTRVPFLDLAAINGRFREAFARAQQEVLASGWFLQGDHVRAFEAEFAAWTGAAHCVLLGNGYDALRLVLRAWISQGRLAPGDEVLVPANSFIASALAVEDAGLRTRFADVDPRTFNLSPETLTAALTPETRAVMPVHLYGRLTDVATLATACSARDLLWLEDAAQAHGARTSIGGGAGTLGHAAAFSFYPTKNLGALGDSGCVVTDDADLAGRVRMLGNYGARGKYEHEVRGVNSRTDELQAAFLQLKLPLLDRDNARRREIAARYHTGLTHPLVTAPRPPDDPASHVWHVYVVVTPQRASLAAHLAAQGIGTLVHYPKAIHRQGAYANVAAYVPPLPAAERLQNEVLSLPISPVMTDAQVAAVIAAVNSWPGPPGSAY